MENQQKTPLLTVTLTSSFINFIAWIMIIVGILILLTNFHDSLIAYNYSVKPGFMSLDSLIISKLAHYILGVLWIISGIGTKYMKKWGLYVFAVLILIMIVSLLLTLPPLLESIPIMNRIILMPGMIIIIQRTIVVIVSILVLVYLRKAFNKFKVNKNKE